MISLVRSFLAVLDDGSINRAAARLHVSQPALSRQLMALEAEVGGTLFERHPGGVRPTSLAHSFAQHMRPVLAAFDRALRETRAQARGRQDELRIGYLMSAAQSHVTPALRKLRRHFPEIKVTLLDLAPGAQIQALRAGTIDVALIGHEGGLISKEFHTRTIASFPVVAALSLDHPLAKKRPIHLKDLRGEPFVGFPDEDLPGRNGWMKDICRPARFRPSFQWAADSLTHALSLVVSEQAVTLLPGYLTKFPHPGAVLRPLHDSTANWHFVVARPRGAASAALQRFLDALSPF